MCTVSSSEMTSLHSALNFFLPSLMLDCEWGNLSNERMKCKQSIKMRNTKEVDTYTDLIVKLLLL